MTFQMFIIALAVLPALALADHAPAYGYAPAPVYCRETNTSIYAEVSNNITTVAVTSEVIKPLKYIH